MTAGTVTPRGRHHRRTGLVLPEPPHDREKASYAWRSLPILAAALGGCALCVIVSQVWWEVCYPVLAIFSWYTIIFIAYQALSVPANVAARSFDLSAHVRRVSSWRPACYPDVDIYLPICGEPVTVLRNTWSGVFELIHAYPGCARAFVLDDGPCAEARAVSAAFGFTYLRRADSRQYGKAGNLNHAFGRTAAAFLVVFDADFRPRADFLAETLPYLDDPTIGIVQTPRFFRLSRGQSWIERAAAPILEASSRSVQIVRDRFAAAACVGSNAVYRRAALTGASGFALIPGAAASHTALDARYNGYRLRYLPLPLAAGIGPATLAAFLGEAYGSCCDATSLVWTSHLWRVPMERAGRLTYLAGWLWNLMAGLRAVVLPIVPVVILACLPGAVQPRNALLLAPALVSWLVLYPLWHNLPHSPRGWPLSLALGWAQVLAIWDYSRGRAMTWTPDRRPADLARRFWRAITAWNGGLALAWVALASWRIAQTGSWRFTVGELLGVTNLAVVGCLIIAGRRSW